MIRLSVLDKLWDNNNHPTVTFSISIEFDTFIYESKWITLVWFNYNSLFDAQKFWHFIL